MQGESSMKQDALQDRDAPGLESMLEVKLEVPLHAPLGKHGPAASRSRFARLSNENVV